MTGALATRDAIELRASLTEDPRQPYLILEAPIRRELCQTLTKGDRSWAKRLF